MRIPGLVVLASSLLAAPALAGPGPAPIIGGTNTSVGQFPTTVVLEIGGGLCTGTLLTKDWVLTAAHCVSPEVVRMTQAQITASVRVHFNTVNLRANPGTIVRATETLPHPSFSLNALGAHDIGLIKLATPVTDVTAVPVNLVAAKAPVGLAVTMVGFGATAVGGGGNIGIEFVVPQTSVSCALAGESDANLLCFNQTSGKGKCQGDSGGPSFATIDGTQMQVGITSFGDQDCAQFGADTRTDAEGAFLTEHVPELRCGADGACTAACGTDALPADPDCPVCDDVTPCAAGRTCFQHECIVEPFDPSGVGSTCTGPTDCESGSCGGPSGEDSLCTLACTPGAADACPAGLDCRGATGGGGACWPTDTGGCCDAGNGGGPTSLVGLGLVGALLARRRRRNRGASPTMP